MSMLPSAIGRSRPTHAREALTGRRKVRLKRQCPGIRRSRLARAALTFERSPTNAAHGGLVRDARGGLRRVISRLRRAAEHLQGSGEIEMRLRKLRIELQRVGIGRDRLFRSSL